MLEFADFQRALILKPYQRQEKGVILLSFEEEIGKLARLVALHDVERKYTILYMPSTKGVVSAELLGYLRRCINPIGILPSYLDKERAICEALGRKVTYFPFHAASWVSADAYRNAWMETKVTDLLMVATFASVKRHWLLFKAMAAMPKEIRATIAGVPLGRRTKASILKEANLYGVDDRITIIENPDQSSLKRIFASAKLFCAFSHREGSHIAVAEAMMANVPVVGFIDAEFGTKSLINNETGFLIRDDKSLAASLLGCLEKSAELNPGSYASERSSAEANIPKLNAMLRMLAIERGEEWSWDIVPFFSERLGLYYLRHEQGEEIKNAAVQLRNLGMGVANCIG